MQIRAIVAAAGQGRRMGKGINKQYLLLAGKPVLAHTLAMITTSPLITDAVVVVAPGEEAYCQTEVVAAYGINKLRAIIPGGKERQDSVEHALRALPDDTELVVVHDGARPFADHVLLASLIEAAKVHGAVIPVLPVKDTIKYITPGGKVEATPDRRRLAAVQTPQVFRYDWLMDAYVKAYRADYTGTDDASLLEWAGYNVQTIPGLETNIKLTTPFDLLVGEQILGNRKAGE